MAKRIDSHRKQTDAAANTRRALLGLSLAAGMVAAVLSDPSEAQDRFNERDPYASQYQNRFQPAEDPAPGGEDAPSQPGNGPSRPGVAPDLGSGSVFGDPAAPLPRPPREDMIPMGEAVLRGLDKITARVRQFAVPVGSTLRFGNLEIAVTTCQSTAPTVQPPESTAFLEIVERGPDDTTAQVFSGWMFASSPALNPLDHPVYDVWVMSCRTAAPDEGEGRP